MPACRRQSLPWYRVTDSNLCPSPILRVITRQHSGRCRAAHQPALEAASPAAAEAAVVNELEQVLSEQGTPWLEACVPVVWALAFELWGLGIPVYAEAATSSP